MGTWKYRKPESFDIRGLCVVCNENMQKPRRGKFLPYCSPCEKQLYQKSFKKQNRKIKETTWEIPKPLIGYRKYKKSRCEKCGFVPEHQCQLDVDHIDGNHKNNDPENLQTLCANCHRLKTHRDRFKKTSED